MIPRAGKNRNQGKEVGSSSFRTILKFQVKERNRAIVATPARRKSIDLNTTDALRSCRQRVCADIRIIVSDTRQGASTGPNQGTGIKKRTSQSSKEDGQPKNNQSQK